MDNYYRLPLKCPDCNKDLIIEEVAFNSETLLFECLCIKCGRDVTKTATIFTLQTLAARNDIAQSKKDKGEV